MVLIGEDGSKRTAYMEKAAKEQGMPLALVQWKDLTGAFDLGQFQGAVKIDPPSFQTANLFQGQKRLEEYCHAMQRLSKAACHFLNAPSGICRLMDKRETKQLLQDRGIPATQMFPGRVGSAKELIETMGQQRCYSVFVKPRYFSGAAGVAAVRIHPTRGRIQVYTSCCLTQGELVNTKKLSCLEDGGDASRLLDKLLTLDCVVERWHPKASFQGKSYDMRVVYQFGHIAYTVVRQSKGPITNLHLNNQALDIRALDLAAETWERTEAICRDAVSCFDGIQMAGIDILLEKGTMNPKIIEMNGQGDLIYQDIYGENKIYREQVRELCKR